jgi:Fe(3+) dicitrate transport protein
MRLSLNSDPFQMNNSLTSRPFLPVLALYGLVAPTLPAAATLGQNDTVLTLSPLSIEAEAEHDHVVQGPFLPDVQGTKINSGKKVSLIDLDALPDIANSNYRQALALTPGLYLSEETSPLLSIGYRGLPPGRVQFTQVLADGIPIHADQFGYPEAYYVPPLDTVDRIEFARGGAALLYGPQPGGALNYVTHRPRTDRALAGATENTFGADATWNSFTHFDGTTGRIGYYGYFNHRETDGFRSANSDVALDAGYVKLALDATGPQRLFVTVESYREEHGEPGGLTAAAFATGSRDATRLHDRFELSRDAVTFALERDLQRGQFTAHFWAFDYNRYSQRQRGGGFGTLPTGATAATNEIEDQSFRNYGLDSRLRQEWGAEAEHTFTVGAQLYHADSPRVDSRGASATATTGTVQRASDRQTTYAPVFAENLFRFGALSVTPGLRVENIRQQVKEQVNLAKTAASTPLGKSEETVTVPLLGLGLAYDLAARTQLYANISESYRPVIFTQAVPTSGNSLVPDDLDASHAIQYELGFRSSATPGLVVDASAFLLDFDDQIGTLSSGSFSTTANTGRAQHQGVEAAISYDLFTLSASAPQDQKLEIYANALLLDASYVSGPLDGKTPQYAPDYLVRSGLVYTAARGKAKVAFLGTSVGEAFGDDNNTAQRRLPAYLVWDLTAEVRLPGTPLTALAGVNNVFDELYYNRVTNAGIDPAAGRNYYIGFRAEF